MPTEHNKTPDWASLAQDYLKLWQEFYAQTLKDPSLYESWGFTQAGGAAAFTAPSLFGMAQFAERESQLRQLEGRVAELERQIKELSKSKP